jgi:hypothetical protein
MTGPITRIQYQQELLEFGRNRGIVNFLPKAEPYVMHFPSPDRSGAAPDAASGKGMKSEDVLLIA